MDELRPSPADPPPDVVELCGFVGRDTEEGYWRLYLSSDLTVYLRIAAADIVSGRQSDPAESDFRPSHLIVRTSASVEKVQTLPLDLQAGFLQGAYAAALAATADPCAAPSPARRARRVSAEQLEYPVSGSWICQPQTTIEFQTCFCTINSVQCCIA
ncbi:hypothetical protein ACRYCC_16930 [Actinomadura scrupuli]|uniref:hypothetical protein n=1 Tax=Actinomadura scrupuli TaxID=559629 RepID=UPI003D98843C